MKFRAGNIKKILQTWFLSCLTKYLLNKTNIASETPSHNFCLIRKTRHIKCKTLTVHYTNYFFHMEEIPLFLPEALSPLWLGIPGFSQLTPVPPPFEWVTSEHNTTGQQVATGLTVRGVMGYLELDPSFSLSGEKAPFSKPLRLLQMRLLFLLQYWGQGKSSSLCSSCEAAGWGHFQEINSHAIEHFKLPEFFWNSQDHCHLPFHSLAASPGAARK